MLKFAAAEKLSKSVDSIALLYSEGKFVGGKEIAAIFQVNLMDELSFFKPTNKAGEIFEIPVSASGYKAERVYLVSIGKNPTDLRTAGAALGRKMRGKSSKIFIASKQKDLSIFAI